MTVLAMTQLLHAAPGTHVAIRRTHPVPTRAGGQTGWTVLRLVLAETRPAVQLVFLLRVLCFFLSTAGTNPRAFAGTAAAGIGGWVSVGMAVYLLNGVTDVVGDQVNGSRRPIASGRLPLATAMRTTVLLAAAGLVLCALCDRRLVVLAVAFLCLGYGYSVGPNALKSTRLGFALAVGGGAFLCYSAGSVIGGGMTLRLTVFAAAMALWVGLCSATKDLSDVAGDALAGRLTWPVVFGDRGARRLIAAISLLLGGWFLATIPLLASQTRPAAAVAALGSVALAAVVLRRPRRADRAAGRRAYRTFMAVQYAVNCTVLVSALP
jgi:4-hydroxybenzoate polyprenyltransferase